MFAVGIDVSKIFLDVHIRPEGKVLHFTNNSMGISSLVSELVKYPSCRVILESTGGYEKKLKFALAQAGIDVKTINPSRSRAFAKACGQLAKTDKIDSEILSLFAERMDVYETYQLSQEELFLKDLVKRRHQIVEEIIKEKNRIDKVFYSFVKEDIEEHLMELQKHLSKVEQAIAEIIYSTQPLKEKADILTSMPGVGLTTASVILADLPELGSLDNKQIAALVGVAPMTKESGQFKGRRQITGGRTSVRCALYMATIVALQHNPPIKAFYQNLKTKGKPPKVAITASMRKMITILNQMVMFKNSWKVRSLPENT